MVILKKLDQFWLNSNCTVKKKLEIDDAVIKAKLLHGLESLQMRCTVKKKLDTFQLKGPRKILRMNTTWINKSNTNERVFFAANDKLAMERYQANIQRQAEGKIKIKPPKKDFWGNRKGIRFLSTEYEYMRNKQLARILCKDAGDPFKKLIFNDENLSRYNYGKKGMGVQGRTGLRRP